MKTRNERVRELLMKLEQPKEERKVASGGVSVMPLPPEPKGGIEEGETRRPPEEEDDEKEEKKLSELRRKLFRR